MSQETGWRIFVGLVLTTIVVNFAVAALTGEIYSFNWNSRLNGDDLIQIYTTSDPRGFWGTVVMQTVLGLIFAVGVRK